MQSVQVELPEHWVKLARSPLAVVITALTCLSLTFVPMFLFVLGKEGVSYLDPRVILCFALIFLAPMVYLRLATLCFTQVRSKNSSAPGNSLISVSLWWLVAIGAIGIYFWFRA